MAVTKRSEFPEYRSNCIIYLLYLSVRCSSLVSCVKAVFHPRSIGSCTDLTPEQSTGCQHTGRRSPAHETRRRRFASWILMHDATYVKPIGWKPGRPPSEIYVSKLKIHELSTFPEVNLEAVLLQFVTICILWTIYPLSGEINNINHNICVHIRTLLNWKCIKSHTNTNIHLLKVCKSVAFGLTSQQDQTKHIWPGLDGLKLICAH